MGDDAIEALECLKSRQRDGLIAATKQDIKNAEEMLKALCEEDIVYVVLTLHKIKLIACFFLQFLLQPVERVCGVFTSRSNTYQRRAVCCVVDIATTIRRSFFCVLSALLLSGSCNLL